MRIQRSRRSGRAVVGSYAGPKLMIHFHFATFPREREMNQKLTYLRPLYCIIRSCNPSLVGRPKINLGSLLSLLSVPVAGRDWTGGTSFQSGTSAFRAAGLRASLRPRAEGWALPAGEVATEGSTVETWGEAHIFFSFHKTGKPTSTTGTFPHCKLW